MWYLIDKVYGLLGLSAKAGKIVCGTDACKEAIQRKKGKLLIIAEDASEHTKNDFKYLSEKYNIPIYIIGNIEGLSRCIGKNNKAVILNKDIKLSEAICKIISGGEVIG